MFVTKLLVTNSGNCHSLPYLYKIVANEMGTTAYLTFSPNHIYIKNKCKKTGWYNTELTSGDFPTDGWIMCSGYITNEAIISGIYMDTLSQQQSVAYTLIDLAKGYEKKFGIGDGAFILKSCSACLNYYPNCINALLLKAETQKKLFEAMMKNNNTQYVSEILNKPEAKALYEDMEQTYGKIALSGYREMPEEMYKNWLKSLSQAKDEYSNRKVPMYK